MYIIGGVLAAFLYVICMGLFDSERSNLSIIQKSLGSDVTYLGKDRSKKKYVFAMPFGKEVDTQKLDRLLSRFLGMTVECQFDRYLYVQVFPEQLKKEIPLPSVSKTNKKVQLGVGHKGIISHNFTKYPHMIVAGHTGYGKTNFIKSLMAQLDGEIVLIDLKNSGDYARISAGTIAEAAQVLGDIHERLRERRNRHIYVIVDEAAQFEVPSYVSKKDADDWLFCQRVVHDIATMGRSLKIHLIYATQYPTANVVPGQIKQNIETRVVFRLPTEVGSRVALDENGAEELPAGVFGRAIYKNDVRVQMQTYLMNDYMTEGEGNIVEIRDSQTAGNADIIHLG